MNQQLEVIALQKNGKEYILTTAYNGHEFSHSVEITDNDRVFGVAMPDELNVILQNEYTPNEAKAFLDKVQEKYLLTKVFV
jgi:hypothetical protein